MGKADGQSETRPEDGREEGDQACPDTSPTADQAEAAAGASTAPPAGSAATPVPLLPEDPVARAAALERKLSHLRNWIASINSQMAASNPQLVKNARRLYVGGVPDGTTEEELYQFFSGLIAGSAAAAGPGDALVSCKITPEKGYAFLEFRTVEEASNAMAFDGVQYKDTNLKIRRPSNYDASAALLLGPPTPDPTLSLAHLTMCKTVVEDSWSKVFVGGLPSDWTDDQVKELLKPYGQLKSFNLVMDKATGKSKGYCFCEFDDDAAIDGVIAGLHMKNLNRKLLTVKRALDGLPPNRSFSGSSEPGGSGLGARRGSGGALLGMQAAANAAFGRPAGPPAGPGGAPGVAPPGAPAGLYGPPPPQALQQHPGHPGAGPYALGMPPHAQPPLQHGGPGGPPMPGGWRGGPPLPHVPLQPHGAPGPHAPPGPHLGMGPGAHPAMFGLVPPPGATPQGPPAGAAGGAGGPRPAPIQPPPAAKKGPGGGTAAAAAGASEDGSGAAPQQRVSAAGDGGEGDVAAAPGPLPGISSLPGGVVSAVGW